MSDNVQIYAVGFLMMCFITGSFLIGFGNTFSDQYIGILQKGIVFTDTSCSKNSCDNTYYVKEIFLKSNETTSTCTVTRPTMYAFYGDAENFVSRMQLGTTRMLYQTTYSHGTCLDDNIRYLYNATGYTLLGFSVLCMCVPLMMYAYEYIREWYNKRKNSTTLPPILSSV